ncbi:MAG: VanZ family protein [Coriobacteriales bacterium]|jgi:VanZ family protein|nr:VanZ family protein [Coriobacteriales bacterium]
MSPSDLREKPRRTQRIIGTIGALLWAALIFGLSSIQGSGYPEHPGFLNYIAHFGEYLVLAVLVTLALHGPKQPLWRSALIAVLAASVYAVSDEFHQYFVPGRECDPVDWAVDTLGALVGALATIFYLSFKKVQQSRARDERHKL